MKTVELTDEEVRLIFYMAGYCLNELPRLYKEVYDGMLKKLQGS